MNCAAGVSANDHSADLLEYFHDLRVVWPFAQLAGQGVVDCRVGELGDRAIRIFIASAGESNRLHRVESVAIKNLAGSHNAVGVRTVRDFLHETTVSNGFYLGGFVLAWRGVFHVQATAGVNRKNACRADFCVCHDH